jgi:hypothetical protein
MPSLTSERSKERQGAKPSLVSTLVEQGLYSETEIKTEDHVTATWFSNMHAQDALRSGSLLAERILSGTYQVAKQLIALQGEDRQLLAIQFDTGLAKTVNKSAVAQAMLPH